MIDNGSAFAPAVTASSVLRPSAAMPEATRRRRASGAVPRPSKLLVQPAFAPERGPVCAGPQRRVAPRMGSPPVWSVKRRGSYEPVWSPQPSLPRTALSHALEYAGQPGSTDADLVAPPACVLILMPLSPRSAAEAPAVRPRVSLDSCWPSRDGARGRGSGQRAQLAAADPHAAEYFPAWETLPHERLSPRPDTSGRRLAVLRRLVSPDYGTRARVRSRFRRTPIRSVLHRWSAGSVSLSRSGSTGKQPTSRTS